MPTILRRLPNINPDSAGLPVVTITDEEITLLAYAGLKHWFRADTGVGTVDWKCRKTDTKLVKAAAGFPTLQPALAAYNGKPSLLFPSVASRLYKTGILPVGGNLSVVVVGRAGAADNANLIGNMSAGNTTYIQMQGGGAGGIFIQIGNAGGTSGNFTSGYPRFFADGPNIILGSHKKGVTDGEVMLRVNRGHFASTVTQANGELANDNADFSIGAAGTIGSPGGTMDGGDIAEVMIFDTALQDNLPMVAIIESYLGTRYGIAAP